MVEATKPDMILRGEPGGMLACRRTRDPTQGIMINECGCQKYSVIVKYHTDLTNGS
jgi:hypothetical protein